MEINKTAKEIVIAINKTTNDYDAAEATAIILTKNNKINMNEKVKNIAKLILIPIVTLLLMWSIWGMAKPVSQDSCIQQAIKKHNGISQDHATSTFNVVAKPADGQKGVIGGDSVRVTQGKSINVLWQDASRWCCTTAEKVAAINPDKFVINIDGPGSLHTPTTGPHPTELAGFIKSLTQTYGYKGILVMHPDCNKSEFKHDWNNGSRWYSEGWQLYADYFILLNDTLRANKLPTFTELLIETGGSGMTAKANVQDEIFNNFRSYINDPSIKLAATSDWNKTSFPTTADYYYAQMYDVCYDKKDGGIPALCGVNDPTEKDRAKTLVTNMVSSITLDRLNQVSFIFTYAPYVVCPAIKPTSHSTLLFSHICDCPAYVKADCPTLNSPMFGEDPSVYWNRAEFVNFANQFKGSMNNASVGIWHCESPLQNW